MNKYTKQNIINIATRMDSTHFIAIELNEENPNFTNMMEIDKQGEIAYSSTVALEFSIIKSILEEEKIYFEIY